MYLENIKKQKNQKYKTKKEEINTKNEYNISNEKKPCHQEIHFSTPRHLVQQIGKLDIICSM